MKNDPILDENHITRYFGGASLDNGQVSGASFKLRTNEDGGKDEYLSVNCLELLGKSNRTEQIAAVRRVLSTKIAPGSTARLAVLQVGDVKEYVAQIGPDKRLLRILHRPDEPPEYPDPSHSGIFDTESDEEMIVELISERVLETYPAKSN